MSPQYHNKKASFDYELIERFECGVQLYGPEVKSLRAGRSHLNTAWCGITDDNLWIYSWQIDQYENSRQELDQIRVRKLLVKKKERLKMQKALDTKGLTLIPIRGFFKKGWFKFEIALARGKKNWDKRQTIKARDIERDLNR
jgi:SsrA-binding protein